MLFSISAFFEDIHPPCFQGVGCDLAFSITDAFSHRFSLFPGGL
jgi:hypothetical protein